MRDDLDAVCPACSQPKGQGYGCAVVPEVPPDERSVESGGAPPPGWSLRHCIICGSSEGVHMSTSPVCRGHASPVAFVHALREARAEAARLQERLKAAQQLSSRNIMHRYDCAISKWFRAVDRGIDLPEPSCTCGLDEIRALMAAAP
jgi:hypothetical protein